MNYDPAPDSSARVSRPHIVLSLWPRTVSTSSFSCASKSVRPSVRTLVASLRSASAELIFVVSSSVSDVSSAMLAVESCQRAQWSHVAPDISSGASVRACGL